MRNSLTRLGWLPLAVLAACNGSSGTSDTPGDKTSLAFQQADPVGDTLFSLPGFDHTVAALDLTLIRGEYKGDSLIITLAFSGPVQPQSVAATNSIAGWIELDTDNNPATGDAPIANSFGGSAALGIDHSIDLFGTTATTARIYNNSNGVESTIGATFSSNTVTLRLSLDSVGNTSGNLGLVGVIGVAERPTDLIPNSGSIAVHRGSSRIVPGSSQPVPAGPLDARRGRWGPPAPLRP
ncbi:MAG: hypothetical protein ACREL5_05225 [Gemmatimonadales bacterium]